uniref:uncharacterized protein LOC120822474 n=1 Tax=Gasterosteus aculeatus aculeatus TaxID=481459 RepID=UPI001A98F0AF|nr:uncharacterized protein LOC120822474 [Gasterosteus aculeatus aculeatus]
MRSFKKGKCCSNQTVTSVSGSSCRLNTTTSAAQRLLISTDEMKVLLVVSVMFALLHLGQHEPCNSPGDKGADKKFVKKHILQPQDIPGLDENFDRTSTTEWQKYLKAKGLCKGRPMQSFFEKRDQRKVEAICRGEGTQVASMTPRPTEDRKNFCISDKDIDVYNFEVENNNCKVKLPVEKLKRRVIVACDLFGTKCLPAHFQWYKTQESSGKKCSGGRVSGLV